MPQIELNGFETDWRTVRDLAVFPNSPDLRERSEMLNALRLKIVDVPDNECVEITAATLYSLIAGPGQRELGGLGQEASAKGYCAGIVLASLYLMHVHGDLHPKFREPSLNKAWWYASEFVRKVKFRADEATQEVVLNHSIDEIKTYWRDFKPVAHLWAARVMTHVLLDKPSFPRSNKELVAFLGMAKHFYEFGVSTYPHRTKNPEPYLDSGQSWAVPGHVKSIPIPSNITPDLLLESVQNYRI